MEAKSKSPEAVSAVSASAETGSGLDTLTDKIESSVNQIAEKAAGTGDDAVQTDDQQPMLSLWGAKALELIGATKATKSKSVKFPVQEVQAKKVETALKKEVKKLNKKLIQLRSKKTFKAHIAEEIVLKIREIQRLIESITTMSAEVLRGWYKKLVMAA